MRRPSPAYDKAREMVLELVNDHQTQSRDKMPSERTMSKLLGVSRPTIAKVVQTLVAEGTLWVDGRNGALLVGDGRKPEAAPKYIVGILAPLARHDSVGEAVLTGAVYQPPQSRVSSLILGSVVPVLKEAGCRCAIYHNDTLAEECMVLEMGELENLKGLIALSTTRDLVRHYWRLVYSGLPVVFVERYLPEIDSDWVVSDNAGGAKEAVTHLIRKGHRRIACFTGREETTSALEREVGYREALADSDIPLDEEIIRGPEIVSPRGISTELALKHCVSLAEPATAVFCLNESMVVAAIAAAEKLGLSVPKDVEIAGFCQDALSEYPDVPITRIVQDTHRIGQTAAEILLDHLSGNALRERRQIRIPTILMPV
jgi:DNA-binding LacI/PurR family transcriptional regulator